ncbi:MAG: uncharacterized protein QOE70_1118 [Chthoniobacter sp.]|nr:uncharacterized protein [Chthoniobacter sp.]
MIVVADTSIVLNLCCVQQIDLLRTLFRRVIVPAEVATEFTRLASRDRRFADLSMPDWIEVRTAPQAIPPEVASAGLNPGESAAIVLCLREAADALLIDEALGREVAAGLGIRIIGILGVLLEAKRHGHLSSVRAVLDRLESEAGFWVAATLRARVLSLAAE